VPRENGFRVRTEEKDASGAALDYEQTLKGFFQRGDGEVPRFDLIFLGMGPDGHAAALFPGTASLDETKRLVVANGVEKFKAYRVTFTYPVLEAAACATFLVAEEDKAAALRKVWEDPSSGLPAQRVELKDGRLIWLLDRAAASGLSRP
jgi:6-phosphogluconolactonase